ncbi:hypothetical protein D3869_25945 (plasmid) [Azospirillum brasilense]|uniref:Uncharacterized protein n=1 Tax=Azospirillum brasilense TaxID=192 RepID=A0A4D8RPN0_AZOBR|nr:hypothetical protein [Azospirillum brasilense]QCO18732.1 hypothetical protein D3869_25945 [Azospirillum brasilense]
MAWLPATPASSLPCAIASLARLERADLRFEIADRAPEEIAALAERVEAALETACPAIGVENVLTGIEKLAARFGLELPDADVLEADILEMAGWPAEDWIAGFRGVWSSFRSGFRRFPTVGDFRAAAGQASRSDGTASLRRLAMALRQEQQIRAREIAHRRRQKDREAEMADRQRAAALVLPVTQAVAVSDTPDDPQEDLAPAHPLSPQNVSQKNPAMPKSFPRDRLVNFIHTRVCEGQGSAFSNKRPRMKSSAREPVRLHDCGAGWGNGTEAWQTLHYSKRVMPI